MALAAGDDVVCRHRIIREGGHDVIVIEHDVNTDSTVVGVALEVVSDTSAPDSPGAQVTDSTITFLTEQSVSAVATPAAYHEVCVEAQSLPVEARTSHASASDMNRCGQGPITQAPNFNEVSRAGFDEASYTQPEISEALVPSMEVTAELGEQVTAAAVTAGATAQLEESAQRLVNAETVVSEGECEQSADEMREERHTVPGGSPAAPPAMGPASAESVSTSAETLPADNSKLTITVMDAVSNQETGIADTAADTAALVRDPKCMFDDGLMLNQEPFECSICFSQVPIQRGVVLMDCLHSFCRDCLSDLVKYSERVEVSCPLASLPEVSCSGFLLDREIRALSSEEVLDRRSMLSLKLAGYDLSTGEVWPSLTEATTSGQLAANLVRFECPVCFAAIAPNAGIILKDCLHSFCRSCLVDVIISSNADRIPCPCTSSDYTCDGYLLEEEVRALASPQQYIQYLARSLGAVCRQNRTMLEKLEAAGGQQLAPNTEAFECSICYSDVEPSGGVTLQECLHSFCRTCLAGLVTHCDDACVKCPFFDDQFSCQSSLRDSEIRALVTPEEYEKHLQRSLRLAESSTAGAFHCRSPGCAGWCELEDTVNAFYCPVCFKNNCITCRAIHEDLDCRQYQEKLREDARHNQEARQTQDYINEMLKKREAILCPICGIVIMKKSGCDWLQCSACRKEVCWVTGKARWGPGGPGDVSGGCKCRVNNKRCHPDCTFCH